MVRATIITDASFCHETGAAGWAAWVRVDGMKDAIKLLGQLKRQRPETSGEAEMFAAINGLWLAVFQGKADDLLLQTDCMMVVRLIDGDIRPGQTRTLWKTALATAELTTTKIRARHVKGHTNVGDTRSYVNRWCDEQAKHQMRLMRRTVAPVKPLF